MLQRPTSQAFLERALQLSAVGLLLVGVFLVLKPFLVAFVFAGVIAMSSWTWYLWLLHRVGQQRTVAASLACLVLSLVILGPMVGFSLALAQGIGPLWKAWQSQSDALIGQATELLGRVPLVGRWMAESLTNIMAADGEVTPLVEKLAAPAQEVVLLFGRALGTGVAQIVFAIFFLFFLYRDGFWLGQVVAAALRRLVGDMANELIKTAQSTVLGVMLGMIGTAAAQGAVATIGFVIAGVPGALVLGALTFFASLVPVGPPIIWGGATIWLLRDQQYGWATFMGLYGLLLISSIDNLLKPVIISRTAAMPLPIALVGVAGGVLAFGLAGIFVGPTLLALTINLSRYWLASRRPDRTIPPIGDNAGVPPPVASV